jgi:glycosyltransferase involved in cell wall biosynthesis
MDTVKISFGKPNFMWGRVVANHSFIKALAAVGSGNELTLFVPTQPDVDTLRQTLLADIPQHVSVVPFLSIPAFLKNNPIDIFHTLDPHMWRAAHIRNYMSEEPFAITGVTHSLANEHFLEWALQGNANGIDEGDCLICTTPTAQAVIESAFSRLRANQPDFVTAQTSVIPLGVSLDPYRGERPATRAQLGLQENDFVVLSLGRFDPQAKMDYLPLLNLVALILGKSKRPICFVLAGASDDGSYTSLLKEWVARLGLQENIRFMFDLDDEVKFDLYSTADVFLTLSDNVQETFGLTVVEALAAGLPVVASDWNGYKALVNHGVTGFLVPSKTLPSDSQWEASLSLQPDSLMHMYGAQTTAIDLPIACELLLKLAENPDLVTSMGAAAAASARQFAWDKVVDQYFRLWRRLADEQSERVAKEPQHLGRSSLFRVLDDFSCYPSSRLSAHDHFITGVLGKLVLERKRMLYLYGQMAEVMDLRILNRLLQLCLEPKKVIELTDQVHREFDVDGPRIGRNIIWLYKYGLIELA